MTQKPKYEKPLAHSLTGMSMALGSCVTGGSVGGTFCADGAGETAFCSFGGAPMSGGNFKCIVGPGAVYCESSGTNASGSPPYS